MIRVEEEGTASVWACLFWMVSFTVMLRPFQSSHRLLALVMSSPNFFFNPHPRTSFHCYLERRGWGKGERGRRRQQWERKTLTCRCLDSLVKDWLVTGDWTCNLGMCPHWELNPQPFHLWDDNPTNWSHTSWGSSPTFFVDRGSILGARTDVAPTSPSMHLRNMTLISLGSNFYGMLSDESGFRRTEESFT